MNRRKMIKTKQALLTIALASALCAPAQKAHRLSIHDMFGILETENRTMKANDAAVSTAKKGWESARVQRLPDLNTSLSASYIGNALLTDRDFTNVHGLSSPHFGNNFALDAQQVIYAGGAIDAGIDLAALGIKQAETQKAVQRQNLRFAAIGQYLELQKLANREQVVKSNIALTQRLIANIEDRQRQGVALKNDVTRYQLQLQTLQLQLTKIANYRAIANHQLCNTLNISVNDSIVPTDDVANGAYDKAGEDRWQQQAATSSPLLQLSDLGIDMARKQEKLTRSEMLPKIAVVAHEGFDGPVTFELPPVNKNLNTWYIGVGVTYSLSSLFKSDKKLHQARLATQQAVLQKEVTREQFNNQVQAAYTEYLQSFVEHDTEKKNVQLAQENYQVVNDRYLNQLSLITDMIDASNTLLDAQLREVDAKINIAYNYYKMKYVAGEL